MARNAHTELVKKKLTLGVFAHITIESKLKKAVVLKKSEILRKNKKHYEQIDERPIEEVELADEKSSRPAKDYEKQQKLNKIEQALAQLAPIDREIVILFHKEEKSYEEISEILTVPISTIKTRLHRARLKLKELAK
jgi:RNA polymerase sigma factor (sigma-70 family)